MFVLSPPEIGGRDSFFLAPKLIEKVEESAHLGLLATSFRRACSSARVDPGLHAERSVSFENENDRWPDRANLQSVIEFRLAIQDLFDRQILHVYNSSPRECRRAH